MSNKPNTGALFRNDKEGNDKRPDYKGPLDINGEEWIVAAWLETSRAGTKYLSLKAEPKRQQASGGGEPHLRPTRERHGGFPSGEGAQDAVDRDMAMDEAGAFDDEIPF